MPSYNHKFIYNIVYSNIDNNAENKANRNVTTSKRSLSELSGSTQEGNTTDKENGSRKHFEGIGKRIRTCKRSFLQSEWRKTDTEGTRKLVLPSFLFSNNTILLLQSIDEFCFQINPTLFGALIIK